VNANVTEVTLPLKIRGFTPSKRVAQVQALSGSLDARNSAANPNFIKPTSVEWKHGLQHGETTVTLAARSFTVIRF
jgi:hypothetical protein